MNFYHNRGNSSDYCDNINMPPIIVVGTKLDQAQIVRNSSSLRSTSQIALQFRADEINLVI